MFTMDSSILSLVILTYIFVKSYNRIDNNFLGYRLFIYLIVTNIMLIIIDILGWIFNSNLGMLTFIFNNFFNLLLYVSAPIAGVLWVLYANYQIFRDEKKTLKFVRPFAIILVFNAAASIISLWTGWFFFIDINNVYHRGDFFIIHVFICYIFMAYAVFLIIFNKSIIEKRSYYSLLLFVVPQLVGSLLQLFIYGSSFNWVGMMFSLLIVYINIQDRGLNTDYLTGAYNRRELDNYIELKIRNSTKEKSFSAIMLDIDNFKKINDTFGHAIGDDALQNAVEVLRQCLSSNDFISRYGGDEFCIILSISNSAILQSTVDRINTSVNEYNHKNKKLYKLSFSMGFNVYDIKSKMNSDEFLKHLDILMYDDKKSKILMSE